MAEVVTGEAVVLDLAIARFTSRMVALLVDMAVQFPVFLFVVWVVFQTAAQHLNHASAAAIYTAGFVLVFVGYPTIFETLSRGKTLGKQALGLRVVSDDGGPIRFRQALIRALLAAFVEVWNPLLCFVGLITAMVSAKGKRLGDMAAGTFVIQERVPQRQDLPGNLAFIPPPLVGWAQNLELSRLSDQTAAAASSYLRRFHDLRPAARDELGLQLATAVAAQVSPPPPPGTPPAAYLSAVLAVRRNREQARLSWQAVRQGSAYAPIPGFSSAGLLPALRQGAAPDISQHPVPAYLPGTIPPLPGTIPALPARATVGANLAWAGPSGRPGTAGPPAAAGEPAAAEAPATAGQPATGQHLAGPPVGSAPDDHGFAAPR